MLDENLPAYILKPSTNGLKHQRDLFLAYQGDDPQPAYTLLGADPASPSPTHKNCYAAAVFDAYNPDVLYGEVLARPGWTQPSLSAEEIRRNGGVPPPPQPILPNEFVVQLYNPDQQVRIAVNEGKWGSSDTYEFSMPQSTFRTPSSSALDRGQSDPASLAITPKVNFIWRKESKLGKDLSCFMTGRSTDTHERRRAKKDPDIAIALWRSMRELTIYEPNFVRMEMEDPKGLEIVLILSAVVIKDLYFGGKEHMKELFNISELTSGRKLSGGGRKLSNPQQNSGAGVIDAVAFHPVTQGRSPSDAKRFSLPKLQTTPPQAPNSMFARPPPMADARSQWELDAETARLKAQADAEAREAAFRRREKEKADESERRRLQKMVEEEEKEARRKQAEIERETERLRKKYGVQNLPAHASSSRHRPAASQSLLGSNGLYQQPSSASASALMMSGGNGGADGLSAPKPAKKKSFFGLRSASDEAGANQQRLQKKPSAMW